jgi:hypothetical protein
MLRQHVEQSRHGNTATVLAFPLTSKKLGNSLQAETSDSPEFE